MKKYIFLLAGLLIFAATNNAEAAARKLGRQTLGTGLNPNTFGGNIDVPGTPPGQCGGCRANGICYDPISNYGCPPGQYSISNNGICACVLESQCTGCLSNGTCYNPISSYPSCPTGQHPIKNANGTCGCEADGSSCAGCTSNGTCYNPVSSYPSCPTGQHPIKNTNGTCGCEPDGSSSCAGCTDNNGTCYDPISSFACPSGQHSVSEGGKCNCEDGPGDCDLSTHHITNGVCIENCSGVVCNSLYTPQPYEGGCRCELTIDPSQPIMSCDEDKVYNPVIQNCVDIFTSYNPHCSSSVPDHYCAACEAGYYLSLADGECYSCSSASITNCHTCQSSGLTSGYDMVVCRICDSGYDSTGLVGNQACLPHCSSGQMWNTQLNKCVTGYNVEPHHCFSGFTYSSTGLWTCLRCQSPWTLNDNGTCSCNSPYHEVDGYCMAN